MEIQHIAGTSILLTFSTSSVVINPPEKTDKKVSNASIILNTYPISIPNWSTSFQVKEGQKMFTGGGEYEKDGLYIRGFSCETIIIGKHIQTTSWLIDGDGIRVLILGDIVDKKDVQHTMAEVALANVLIPLFITTKEKRLDIPSLVGIASNLQAQRIVPIGNDSAMRETLVKEIGNVEEITGKYVLKKKDLLEIQTKVILLG